MPKDRLAEMKGQNGGNEIVEEKSYPRPSNDIEENNGSGLSSYSKLSHQAKEIRDSLEETQEKVSQMRSLHNRILSAPNSDPSVKEMLSELTQIIIKEMSQIGKDLKEINKTVAQDHAVQRLTTTEHRMILTNHSSLFNKFKTVWEELCTARNDYEKRCRLRMQRQLDIVGYTMTDEQMNEAMTTGVPIFSKDFVESESAKSALCDLKERNKELETLEKGLRGLHSLFLEVNLTIENQGDLVDSVESRIVQAEGDLEAGGKRLAEERVKMGATRWKKFKCCGMFFLVALVVIGLVLLVKQYV